MAWIDNKIVYNMVPQNCIINRLKMYKISYDVINFIGKNMKSWRVELTARGRSLAEAKHPKRYFSKRSSTTVTIHNCHDTT